MDSIPQSPSIKTVSSHGERNTGFPESFCGHGNTSLRHPDARVGADACITAEDIPVARALHRRSFLGGNKYSKRTISHGRLTAEQQQSIVQQQIRQQEGVSVMYSDNAILESDAESPTLLAAPFMPPSRQPSFGTQPGRQSKDSFDRCSSTSAHGPNDGPTMAPSSPSSSSTSRSRGVFRKIRWNRD